MPPSGQTFTTLKDLRAGEYHNVWKQDDDDKRIQCVSTEPKVGRVVDDKRRLVSMECVLIWVVRDRPTGFLTSNQKRQCSLGSDCAYWWSDSWEGMHETSTHRYYENIEQNLNDGRSSHLVVSQLSSSLTLTSTPQPWNGLELSIVSYIRLSKMKNGSSRTFAPTQTTVSSSLQHKQSCPMWLL